MILLFCLVGATETHQNVNKYTDPLLKFIFTYFLAGDRTWNALSRFKNFNSKKKLNANHKF